MFKLLSSVSCAAETYLTSFARLFVSLLVAFSYPLQCHPARRCIITLVGSVQASYFPQAEDQQALAASSPSSSPSSSSSSLRASDAGGSATAEIVQYNIITVSNMRCLF